MTTPAEAARKALRGRTRLINDTAGEVRKLLAQADRQIAAILAAAPSDYQQWLLPQLQAEIRRALAVTGGEAASAVDLGQQAAWRAGSTLVDDVVAAAGVRSALPQLDVQQLTAMRGFLTEKIKGVTLEAANAINAQLGLVTIGAQTPFDAVKQVSSILKADTQRRATTIVHTELARAYSTANQARMEQTAKLVPGMKKRWVKSGKLHPRLSHAVIHGQEQLVGAPFLLEGGAVKMMYPHDPSAPARHTINCGCVAVPVVPGFRRTTT
ncbi:phage minor head protein [Aromatoleum evansii]|uniref:phage minor head protein n=1 Tax=Aromatoleum evansii TaxID=59406 RepID=UPI00145E70B4|nr:phage minor head protein [Aromatoleum evansii]NMG29351.1 hypothetical protein [Aromatoleum evansii]